MPTSKEKETGLRHCYLLCNIFATFFSNFSLFIFLRMSTKAKELINQYFNHGYDYNSILALLKKENQIEISIRTLQRYLKSLSLRRKNLDKQSANVLADVELLLKNNGNSQGYRSIKQQLSENGIQYSFETVRLALKVLDPEGTEERRKKKLKRRKYVNAGPNEVWHIDGNDKIKPFGFAIHGGIDGYSRKILWLRVANTNKHPGVISSYYTKALEQLSAAPRRVRADRGTENGTVCGIQRFLRRNHSDSFAGEKSFQYGKSVSNQRIESWWSFLKRHSLQNWINYFKDLREQGFYDDSNNVHVQSLKFCFYGIIQTELDSVVKYWNHHRIRPSKGAEGPSGRPNLMYLLPDTFNGVDRKVSIDLTELHLATSTYAKVPDQFCCSEEFSELARIIMTEKALAWPNNKDEAEILYFELVDTISKL